MSLRNTTNDQDGTSVYTTCRCNCGGNHQCVLKAHVRNGKIMAVEPDDRFNTNVGREDEVLSDADLIKVRIQRRPCVMGLAFHRYLYHPDRILYPMKRKPGTPRGQGEWVRISWDEALDTIADTMRETRERYGPYSIVTPYANRNAERFFSFWGAGVNGWGWCSFDAARLMAHVIAGGKGWEMDAWSSGSAPDMLAHTKLIVLWGTDPTVGHQGPAHMWAWFIKLARERGIPVIIFDPRYSVAAGTLADQWIPIKPGTDRAMFMALAHSLFMSDLWNKEFVAKYVDPLGFEKWRDYVLGKEDGIPKTPEWAETRCAVPAATIHALARLIGTIKPAWLWSHWAVARKGDGEQTVGAFTALQAMMGYWGTPGAGPPLHPGSIRRLPVGEWVNFGGPPGDYKSPKLYRSHNWAEAVLLLDRVRKGELSEKEYMKTVGWQADPAILKEFNPRFLFFGGNSPHSTNHVVTACSSSNNQVRAFSKMDFVVHMHDIMTPTGQYADIFLPVRSPMWEEKGIVRSASYGTVECINYCPGVVEPAGEVKNWLWIYVKLAERLGMDPKKMFGFYTNDEHFDDDLERASRHSYDELTEYYKRKGITIPAWEDFSKGDFINCDEHDEEPFTGFDEQMKQGKPFNTASGKIELFSRYVADEANRGRGEHYDALNHLYDNLPSDWGGMTPSPTYKAMHRGMDDPLTREYPLMLITPHSRYRVHYLFWEHPWLKDHVYRHRVWLNVADARARGIIDGDMIEVYNDRGKVLMPAYVTSRIMPGVVLIHSGGKVIHDENGVDLGASPSTLLGGDFESCLAPARATNLVQIKKHTGKRE